MTDMTEKIFEVMPYGKAALKKMGDVPENFRLYFAELKGKHPDYHGMCRLKVLSLDRQRPVKTRASYQSLSKAQSAVCM